MNQQKALENNYACSSDSHLPEPCSRFGAIIGSWAANGLTNSIKAHHPENVRIQSKPPVLKRCLWKSCTYGFQWGKMGDFLKPRLRTPEGRRLRLLLARQRGPHQRLLRRAAGRGGELQSRSEGWLFGLKKHPWLKKTMDVFWPYHNGVSGDLFVNKVYPRIAVWMGKHVKFLSIFHLGLPCF